MPEPRLGFDQDGLLAHEFGLVMRFLQGGGQLEQITGMLDQIVGHAQAQGAGGDLLAAVAGDQHHRQVQGAFVPQRLDRFQRIEPRQAIVEQQHVIRQRFAPRVRQAVQHLGHAMHHLQSNVPGVLRQMALGQIDIERIVLGVQYPQRAGLTGALGVKARQGGGHDLRQPLQIIPALDQIIVGAGLESGHHRLLVAGTGQDDDRQRQTALANVGQQIEAVAVRQAQFREHQIISRRPGQPVPGAVEGRDVFQHAVRRQARQGAPDQIRVEQIVLEVEYAQGRIHDQAPAAGVSCRRWQRFPNRAAALMSLTKFPAPTAQNPPPVRRAP